ncbi:MAG: hypothetical protein HP490_03915 [Nitrospira sp.]|nr:hypothetical protein [Nitrospira sp.]
MKRVAEKEKDGGHRTGNQYLATEHKRPPHQQKPDPDEDGTQQKSQKGEGERRDLLKRRLGSGKRGAPDQGRQE